MEPGVSVSRPPAASNGIRTDHIFSPQTLKSRGKRESCKRHLSAMPSLTRSLPSLTDSGSG